MTLRTLTTSISIEARANSCDANYASTSGLEDPFPGRWLSSAIASPWRGDGSHRGELRPQATLDATVVRPARNSLPEKVKPDIEPAPPSTSRRALEARPLPARTPAIESQRVARLVARAPLTIPRRGAFARSIESFRFTRFERFGADARGERSRVRLCFPSGARRSSCPLARTRASRSLTRAQSRAFLVSAPDVRR